MTMRSGYQVPEQENAVQGCLWLTLLTNGKAHETLLHLFGPLGEQAMAKVVQRLSPTKG